MQKYIVEVSYFKNRSFGKTGTKTTDTVVVEAETERGASERACHKVADNNGIPYTRFTSLWHASWKVHKL